ncbi:MAG: oligosaccharide flippase family protein [Flavobacteriales bacterium]
MRSLSQNLIQTFLVQFPTIFLGVISGVFITRILGPEGKGVHSIMFANLELLALFLSFGADLGIVYFMSNKKIAPEKLAGLAFWTIVISVILAFMMIFLSGKNWNIFFPEKYDGLFYQLFLFVIFCITLINGLCASFLKGAMQFKRINRIMLFNSVINVLGFGLLYLLRSSLPFEAGIKSVLIASILMLTLNSVFWIYSFLKLINIKPDIWGINKMHIKLFYGYTIVGFMGMVVNFFNYRLDIWMVSYYKGEEQLGYYTLAVNVAQFMLLFSRTMGVIMLPYLSEKSNDERKELFVLFSRINTTITLGFLLIFLVVGQLVIPLLYGQVFIASVPSFYILIFAVFFTCISQLQTTYFASNNMNMQCLNSNILALSATVLFNFLLIPKYGIIGAAYATLISYSVNFAYLYFIQLKSIDRKMLNIFVPAPSDYQKIKALIKKHN